MLSTGITEQVIVTAETGPKTGAGDQATGTILFDLVHNSFCIIYPSHARLF